VFVNNVSAKGADFDNVTSTNLESAQKLVESKQITMQESALTSWAGQNAYKLVYTKNSSGLKCMQIWTVKNDTMYQLTYNAQPQHYNEYMSTVQKMIDSFQFT
jgi:serine/threonine-protein kinase